MYTVRSDQQVLDEAPKPVQQNIRDVRDLWPYLNIVERFEWVDRFKGMDFFSDVETPQMVRILSWRSP